MDRKQRMEQVLMARFTPVKLDIADDSARHAGHAGASPEGQTHYSITIESIAFRGMSRVQKHQAVYQALQSEFSCGLHALSIQASAPGE